MNYNQPYAKFTIIFYPFTELWLDTKIHENENLYFIIKFLLNADIFNKILPCETRTGKHHLCLTRDLPILVWCTQTVMCKGTKCYLIEKIILP